MAEMPNLEVIFRRQCGVHRPVLWEGHGGWRLDAEGVRTISKPVGPFTPAFSNGVPFTATSAFTGTLSGCSGSVASVCSRPILSTSSSPSPMIPPLHTLMPASRTADKVSNRSEYLPPPLAAQ